MNNIIDLQSYFDEGLQYKVGDKIYTVDGSLKTYLNFTLKMKELESKKSDEETIFNTFFEYAFGKENAQELLETKINGKGMSIKLLMKMMEEIKKEWMGESVNNTPSK